MDQILEALKEGFIEHWSKVVAGAVFMAIGGLFGWWRARKKWQRKEFFERINFSLNSLQGGKLRIRTLMEKSCFDVFLNQIAVKKLLQAAAKTTAKDPIIPLAANDYWFYLNAALNEVSEKFALGFLKRDIGEKVDSHIYLLCLTNEQDGNIRNRKIRAMLIREVDLTSLPEEPPEFESKNHTTRWETLKTMAKSLEENPHQFFRVELVI